MHPLVLFFYLLLLLYFVIISTTNIGCREEKKFMIKTLVEYINLTEPKTRFLLAVAIKT